MAAKYHITEDGPKPCSATIKTCKYGQHFDDEKTAWKTYSEDLKEKYNHLVGITKKLTEPPKSLKERWEKCGKIFNKRKETQTNFTKEELIERQEVVDNLIKKLVDNDKETIKTHTTVVNGETVWNENRQKQHIEIIKHFMNEFDKVPKEQKAIISGGLPGAGKSTVLGGYAGIDKKDYATINPDDIKELMAEKGMIPKIKGMSPMEVSPLVHEEASYLSKVILKKLQKNGSNVILDVTMASFASTERKVNDLKKNGYSVEPIFVDISPDMSLERSRNRYSFGMNDFVQDKSSIGGRIVPSSVSNSSKSRDKQYKSNNSKVFVDCVRANLFTEKPRIYDNMGDKPVQVNFDDFIGNIGVSIDE